MYKTANTIRMLQILYSGGIVKKRDLAAELETNERNIREYKRELVMAGYDIIEHKGRNGGLELGNSSIIPASQLSQEEAAALLEGRSLVHTHQDFASRSRFDAALDKLFSSALAPEREEDTVLYLSRRKRDPACGIFVEMEICKQAIRQQRRLRLTYRRRDGNMQDYVVEPYKVFYYEGAYYLFADKVDQRGTGSENWRFFRFSPMRMKTIRILEERFSPFTDFSIEEHLAQRGFVKVPDTRFTVKVRKEADHLFREQDWGDDLQRLGEEEEWVRYSFWRDEKEGLFSQLLQFGPGIILEGPKPLQEEFLKRLDSIREHYS